MSSVVAIFNKQAVAIAADSAATISKGKTFYTAQKIFQLSPRHNIGVMVYGDSSLMDRFEWEIIIHEFGKEIDKPGAEKHFDTVEEYYRKFLQFVSEFSPLTKQIQKNYFDIISWLFLEDLKDVYDEILSEDYNNQKISDKQKHEIMAKAIDRAGKQIEEDPFSPEYKPDEEFFFENEDIITKNIRQIFSGFIAISPEEQTDITGLFLEDIKKLCSPAWIDSTGVVFAGYGAREYFPAHCGCHIYGKLGSCLIHGNIAADVCGNGWTSNIVPMAQRDVIDTFIWGIAPDANDKFWQEINDLTGKAIEIAGNEHAEALNGLKDAMKERIQTFLEENYKSPVVDMVAALPKRNLADMAESFVNITSLRRRVSTDDETVGGPTDVAIITKVDGFVWVKKKNLYAE